MTAARVSREQAVVAGQHTLGVDADVAGKPDPLHPWHYLAVPNSIVVYTVRAEFDDPSLRERYLAWLRDGHCAAVVREGGALSGEVTVLDDGLVESRYLFGSRADFAAYEAGPAVALRVEGNRLFPPEQGVRFGRSLGVREIRVPD